MTMFTLHAAGSFVTNGIGGEDPAPGDGAPDSVFTDLFYQLPDAGNGIGLASPFPDSGTLDPVPTALESVTIKFHFKIVRPAGNAGADLYVYVIRPSAGPSFIIAAAPLDVGTLDHTGEGVLSADITSFFTSVADLDGLRAHYLVVESEGEPADPCVMQVDATELNIVAAESGTPAKTVSVHTSYHFDATPVDGAVDGHLYSGLGHRVGGPPAKRRT